MKNNNKGQSLLEIIVILGVIMVVVIGLVVVAVNSLRNSQLAKNQIQATLFAQQAIDNVRTIKGSNCPLKYSGTDYSWVGSTGNVVWINRESLAGLYKTRLDASNCWLEAVLAEEEIAGTSFKRKIEIAKDAGGIGDSGSSGITVKAIVSWNDLSGPHQSMISTILTK